MATQPALHPEPTTVPTGGMRWMLPEIRLPIGRLLWAPGTLGELIAGGAVHDPWCEPRALRLSLPPARSWRQHGAHVRGAILDALPALSQWQTDNDRPAVLRAVIEEVLAGPVGDYIASHGGHLRIEQITEDTVTVALEGTCGHCPAAGQTLHQRLETAVRQWYPDLRRIHVGDPTRHHRPRAQLWSRPRPPSPGSH